jgi:hypothetical protein
MSRPGFQKTLVWPFGGDHWPPTWPEINLKRETFSSRLHANQKQDLIECFYEQESSKTAYRMRGHRCTLYQLRDYFGKAPHHIKAAVCQSTEYKECCAELEDMI